MPESENMNHTFIGMHDICDAIRSADQLTKFGPLAFRHHAAPIWQAIQGLDDANELFTNPMGSQRTALRDIVGYRAQVFERSRRPDYF